MKIQTPFILLGLLLAVAQGSGFINWAGSWDVTETESNDACYPDTTILIEQSAGHIIASWVWEKTQACIQAKIAGQKFTQTVENPEDGENYIYLELTVGEAVVDGTFTITKNTAAFKSKNGASATYLRRFEYGYWTGTWDIVTQDKEACIPDKSITLTQYATSFFAEWTWADSSPCRSFNVAGERFVQNVEFYVGNDATISFKDGNTWVERMLTVINDQLIFSNTYGAAATFVRRQELVSWVGTWDFVKLSSYAGCYPKGDVTVLPSGDNLAVSWIWDTETACRDYGLSGKSFSQTVPVPKGGALSLNYIAEDKHVSGILHFKENDQISFTCHTGNSATFNRRPQMVNWAGAWEIATQDKTTCYPEGSINAAQTSSNITFSWIWAKTAPCSTLALAGNKFNKTINTPAGNSAQLDVSTTVSVLFTVFHDEAVFSTNGINGGASTYNRKEENVKFVGTWNIDSQQAGTACFPDASIIITQDGGSITAKWTWADSTHCQNAGLVGNEFTQTGPTPRGRAIFLDLLVKNIRVSGIFTVNGDQATFASNNGASAAFNRKSSSDSSTDPKNDSPTEPSKEPSTEPSTDSKSGSSTGIIALIIIIVLAIGAYFYVQKTRGKKLEEDLNVSLSGIYAKP